jgi:hypothetical protein
VSYSDNHRAREKTANFQTEIAKDCDKINLVLLILTYSKSSGSGGSEKWGREPFLKCNKK